MRRRLVLVLVTTLLSAGLAGAATPAGAGTSGAGALVVQSSTVLQSGQELVWQVTLDVPFSPAALSRAGRSLCLQLDRARGTVILGLLCVAAPRPGGRIPRMTFRTARSTPRQARVIAAQVTRSGARELTARFLPMAVAAGYQPMRWQVQSTLASRACRPVSADGSPCVARFPAAPALARLHTPQLVGCVPAGPDFVYSGPSDRRAIALTFDDGPWYQTPQFLDLLERERAPATFFQIGRQIAAYGEEGALERRMLADGDMIGDHTWSHLDVARGGAVASAQITDAADAIRQATGGFTPCLFRAPYGDVGPALLSQARALGYTTIQWNIDPRDWARPGVAEIESNVLDNARPGAIVEMHDGGGDRSETLQALPDIIRTLRARGYALVTVTQLLGQQLVYR